MKSFATKLLVTSSMFVRPAGRLLCNYIHFANALKHKKKFINVKVIMIILFCLFCRIAGTYLIAGSF